MRSEAWVDVVEYLWRLGARDYGGATDLLDAAIDRDGVGAINDALGDVCRTLMDRVFFPAGTIDVHAVVDRIALRVVDRIALRVVEGTSDKRPEAIDRQRSLLVYLGSEGLPCVARADVASWDPQDRLHDLIACTLGLLGVVAEDEQAQVAEVVAGITPPGPVHAPEGEFALAWRGPNGAEPFAGVVPRGYTAHITFLGSEPCSLRSIFGRVALLRDLRAPVDETARVDASFNRP